MTETPPPLRRPRERRRRTRPETPERPAEGEVAATVTRPDERGEQR